MNATIKNHKVQINGNLITGDTYPVKSWIKEYLNGKWDADRRGWVVDPKQLERFLNKPYGVMPDNTIAATPANINTHTRNDYDLCPKCHTYCYGDCTAR
ncbi:hypothetical protein BECAL_02303 [Bellilinea caldifistulae]|uniref:Uncharacterized protein n=1 Tax=Bellilinea caldifistulae TaxID=360411 RepID=A0A0P6WUA7_9CHLR|nr:hypothetical protein [Bellilinea caldifistulae]KPL73837.1 hypothetical protein AC812_13690 [Bellilinea caldifistulae]GAP11118.1 hypothetical protein BECAL_02303 [Bellilinea caldifistulae]